MEHHLIVDDTGQLKGTAVKLAAQVGRVSFISSNRKALDEALEKAGQNKRTITTFHVDLTNQGELRSTLERCIGENGPADVTVAAIGSLSPDTATVMAQAYRSLAVFTEFFDVISPGDDLAIAHQREGRLRSFENVWYRKIEVGFVMENGSSRWPNEGELTEGIVNAIATRPIRP
jgi:hypothetical protein